MKHFSGSSRIFKKVTLTTILPGQRLQKQVRAPKKQGFPEKGVEEILAQHAKDLERVMPGVEFRMVELGPDRFNFIHQACDPQPVQEQSL